jgi:hypothetical protein
MQHSTVREGLLTGTIGALIVALWYLVFDTAVGRPFHTPDLLGRVLFRGQLSAPGSGVVPELVLGYTVLHFVFFVLVGMGLTLLVHLAARNITLRMGVWMGLVIAFCFLVGLTYMLTAASSDPLPLWSVIGGSLLGVAAMGWYLWRQHPRLSGSFREAPLGDEVRAPPHPPAG